MRRFGSCLAGILLLIVSWSAARGADGVTDVAAWPETRVAELTRQLLEIINHGEQATARTFIEKNFDPQKWADFPPEAMAEWLMGVRKASGALEFRTVRTYADRPDDDTCVAILYSAGREQWKGMSVTVGGNGLIAAMVIMAATPPKAIAAAAGPLDREGFARELDDYLTRMTAEDQFAGAVLVAHDGEVLFEKAYGEANRSDHVANRVDTRFNLASMNKMFTAVAIAQLAERGRLSYDDTVDRYLPEGWLDPALARKIRIDHLLTHTSGLGDFMGDDRFWKGSRLEFTEVDDFKPLIRDLTPDFEPGSAWGYSNAGYLLLGVIVERVAGMPYERYVAQNIYDPAGMPDTRFFELDRPLERLAVGYYRDEDASGNEVVFNNWFLHTVKGSAAGGGWATVRDLLAFDRALRADKLLRPETRDALWAVTPASRQRMLYGRGFIVGEREGDRRAGHGGTFPGISGNLEMYLDRGWTVAVLCNLSSGIGAPGLTAKIDEYLARVR